MTVFSSTRLRALSWRAAAPALVLAVALVAAVGAALIHLAGDEEPPEPHTRETTVDVPRSPDSSERIGLDTTLYIPESTPAPAVLLPHGFGGSKTSVARDATELAEHGFVVLTYSARGFGQSGGTISLNDPQREVADASRLIDYLADQSVVRTDDDDVPTVGVTGSSYAGALALLLAGTDDRVDAIAPVMTYNDLESALLPQASTERDQDTGTPAGGTHDGEGVLKQEWAGTLFAGGMATTDPEGSMQEAPEPGESRERSEDPQDEQDTAPPAPGEAENGAPQPSTHEPTTRCGRFAEHICRAYTEMATTGTASEQTRELLGRISPASVTGDITIPTLLVQGQQDTLFGLEQADANARQIARAGGDVTTIWYAGGHDGGGPGEQLRDNIAGWLANQLTGEGEQLPAFSYDVQGSFDAAGAPSVRVVEAAEYPGLYGGSTPREPVTLAGQQQTVVRPPGGSPAALSSMPGMGMLPGAAAAGNGAGTDLPSQSAAFTSRAFDEQQLVTGSSTITLNVSAPVSPESESRTDEAVLFAKLYDVGPAGARSLPGGAVAPVRVSDLPADGSPAELTVNLPAIVHPIEAGHRLQLVVTTTDRAYAVPDSPATYQISLAEEGLLSAPSVPGTSAQGQWPVGQLIGIGGVLLAAAAITLVASYRRRAATTVAGELAETPLRIDRLTKSYAGGIHAVSELSFSVERGQVLGLLGPNGAGKTTALRMLMGLVTPSSGDIWAFGRRVVPGAPVLSRIGSFVEGPGFLPHVSGRKNLELFWDATGQNRDQAHIAEVLEIAGLGDAIHRKVRTYSQGMRQRLAIAQAMLGLPELLVLDEPTNGLDPPQIHQLREVLRRYADTGRTVLVSSHLLAEVEQTATHVVVMHHGTKVADGAVSEIVAAGGEATFVVDRPEEAVRTLNALEGVTGIDVSDSMVHADLGTTPRSRAVAALVAAGIAVEHAGARRRLEDAFLRLVGEEGAAQ